MKACIYARTSRHDKGHHKFSIERQEEAARAIAAKHGLTVAYEHVFTDTDYAGEVPPTCWAYTDDQDGRPALSALIEAVEEERIERVIVRKMDRLGTTSEVLNGLLELFAAHNVFIVATPEATSLQEDPTEAFAVSVLHPRIQYDTDDERRRKAQLKQKKVEEISRLKLKIDRLESEIAELGI
ncbi:MAG: recombinase family protein [Verrucomicrobia bacterium]|jgi:DNA invertase Pin-like site-specific DNA recombinase|nr:recombinase family protein [Verrucomicrobiota bacterium]